MFSYHWNVEFFWYATLIASSRRVPFDSPHCQFWLSRLLVPDLQLLNNFQFSSPLVGAVITVDNTGGTSSTNEAQNGIGKRRKPPGHLLSKGPVQTPNFSWAKPNSNYGRPKLFRPAELIQKPILIPVERTSKGEKWLFRSSCLQIRYNNLCIRLGTWKFGL